MSTASLCSLCAFCSLSTLCAFCALTHSLLTYRSPLTAPHCSQQLPFLSLTAEVEELAVQGVIFELTGG